jgi:hypothetical protein
MMTTFEKTAIMKFAIAFVKEADLWNFARDVDFDEKNQATIDYRIATKNAKVALFSWQDDFNRVGFTLTNCLSYEVDEAIGHSDIDTYITNKYPSVVGDSESGQMFLYGPKETLTLVADELEEKYKWYSPLVVKKTDRNYYYPDGIFNWGDARRYVKKNS